jgi:hypothetical protein
MLLAGGAGHGILVRVRQNWCPVESKTIGPERGKAAEPSAYSAPGSVGRLGVAEPGPPFRKK